MTEHTQPADPGLTAPPPDVSGCGTLCADCDRHVRCQYCGACRVLDHTPGCPGPRGGIRSQERARARIEEIIAAAPHPDATPLAPAEDVEEVAGDE